MPSERHKAGLRTGTETSGLPSSQGAALCVNGRNQPLRVAFALVTPPVVVTGHTPPVAQQNCEK